MHDQRHLEIKTNRDAGDAGLESFSSLVSIDRKRVPC